MNKCIAEQRQRILLDMLAAEGSLNATEVAERLNTTGATVRRDLNKLAEMGLCKRTHGGAIVLTPRMAVWMSVSLSMHLESRALPQPRSRCSNLIN